MTRRGHILIADDNDDQRELLGLLLEREGFDVSQAHDGQGLLDLVDSVEKQGTLGGVTLIISDIMMPVVSGFDALEALRRDGVRVPLVFISALNDPQTLARAKRGGALSVLPKPFEISGLRHLLNKLSSASAA